MLFRSTPTSRQTRATTPHPAKRRSMSSLLVILGEAISTSDGATLSTLTTHLPGNLSLEVAPRTTSSFKNRTWSSMSSAGTHSPFRRQDDVGVGVEKVDLVVVALGSSSIALSFFCRTEDSVDDWSADLYFFYRSRQ